MGKHRLGMGGRVRARRRAHRPEAEPELDHVARAPAGRAGVVGPAALVAVLALTAACSATDLEVVSGPTPGQPPTTVAPVTIDAEPPPTGIPDTIPTTSSSSSTSSSTTTSTAPPSSTTTAPEGDDDPGLPGEPGGGGATTTALQADLTAADASVAFVNQRRAENGLGPLTVDAELQVDAEEWARQMAVEQNMYHDPDRGTKMPPHYGWWGENVAMGPDPGGLDQAWWESDGHRANILGENYQAVGIAFVPDGRGTYWAVQIFGG